MSNSWAIPFSHTFSLVAFFSFEKMRIFESKKDIIPNETTRDKSRLAFIYNILKALFQSVSNGLRDELIKKIAQNKGDGSEW